MDETRTMTTLRLTEAERRLLDRAAAEIGSTRSALLREGGLWKARGILRQVRRQAREGADEHERET